MFAAMALEVIVWFYLLSFGVAAGVAVAALLFTAKHIGRLSRPTFSSLKPDEEDDE